VERPGRDRVAAVSGVLFVVVLLAGLYVAPDLVYPEEQVEGVSGTFYVNYESRLLAQAVLFGVASVGADQSRIQSVLIWRETHRGGCPGLRRTCGGGPRLMPAVW
jgi:hypothetical protein